MNLIPNIKRDYVLKNKMLMFCLLKTYCFKSGIKYKGHYCAPDSAHFPCTGNHVLPTAPVTLPVFYVALLERLSLSRLKIKY